MMGVLALLLKWWTLGAVAILGAGVAAWCACRVARRIRSLRKACPVVAVLATLYGGSKSIDLLPRFSADDGLTVTAATLEVPTNAVDNAYMTVEWAGPDEDRPLSVRESRSETWAPFGAQDWLFDWRFYENGTNRATWWVDAPATNVQPHAFYHLGSDLPPVEIEGDGVTIEDFRASSTNVVLTYAIEHTCVGGHVGTARVELQEARGAVWMEVSAITVSGGVTNTVTFPGFWIGKDTRWRVRLEVEQ